MRCASTQICEQMTTLLCAGVNPAFVKKMLIHIFFHARLPEPVSYSICPKCSLKSSLWQYNFLTYGSFFTSLANTGNKVLYKNLWEKLKFLSFKTCAASLYELLIFIGKVKNKFYIKVEILFSFTKINCFYIRRLAAMHEIEWLVQTPLPPPPLV